MKIIVDIKEIRIKSNKLISHYFYFDVLRRDFEYTV